MTLKYSLKLHAFKCKPQNSGCNSYACIHVWPYLDSLRYAFILPAVFVYQSNLPGNMRKASLAIFSITWIKFGNRQCDSSRVSWPNPYKSPFLLLCYPQPLASSSWSKIATSDVGTTVSPLCQVITRKRKTDKCFPSL